MGRRPQGFADFDFRGEFGYTERGGWRQALYCLFE
jgi:hypothetical protein